MFIKNSLLERIDKNKVEIKVSEICKIHIDQARNDGSHFYDVKYKFVPNLIYLDGPDPQDVIGVILKKTNKSSNFI